MAQQVVTISLTITPEDGGRPVKISAEYPDNSWRDVLNVEKAVIPPIIAALFQLGEQYAAAEEAPKT